MAQAEGAEFWLQVFTQFKNRGVQDIFIACVDGLKSFRNSNSRRGVRTLLSGAKQPQSEIGLCVPLGQL